MEITLDLFCLCCVKLCVVIGWRDLHPFQALGLAHFNRSAFIKQLFQKCFLHLFAEVFVA